MFTTIMTTDGQTQIPNAIQHLLNLQPGDRIDFIIAKDGKVYLQPTAIDVRELSGILYQPGQKTVSLEEMDAAIAQGAGESV